VSGLSPDARRVIERLVAVKRNHPRSWYFRVTRSEVDDLAVELDRSRP
jgi:hypothetical protein